MPPEPKAGSSRRQAAIPPPTVSPPSSTQSTPFTSPVFDVVEAHPWETDLMQRFQNLSTSSPRTRPARLGPAEFPTGTQNLPIRTPSATTSTTATTRTLRSATRQNPAPVVPQSSQSTDVRRDPSGGNDEDDGDDEDTGSSTESESQLEKRASGWFCLLCNSRTAFARRSDVKRHWKSGACEGSQSSDNLHKCVPCGKSFGRSDALLRHERGKRHLRKIGKDV